MPLSRLPISVQLPGREAQTRESSKPLTWREIELIAYGELTLKPWELDEYTLDELLVSIQASRKAEYEDFRTQLQHTRLLCYHAILPHMKKTAPIDKVFPWFDEKKKGKKRLSEMTKAERIEHIQAIQSYMVQNVIKNDETTDGREQ